MIGTCWILPRMRKMFQTKVVEKFKTRIFCSVTSFLKIVPFVRWCWKIWYSQSGLRWQYNKVHTLCMQDKWGYRHTLRLCNTYSLSTATMVTWMFLSITFYMHLHMHMHINLYGRIFSIKWEKKNLILTIWHTNFFCELGGTNRFITLKIDTICLCHTPFDRSFFSSLNWYMTCNAIYWQKARIKSKTSVAQTASQPAVYAKGLTCKSKHRRCVLTLSVHMEYMYSAVSHASCPDKVLILRDFRKVLKWAGTGDFKV
jgi:hypothetical protein